MAIEVSNIVLNLVLTDPAQALEVWPKIKLVFFRSVSRTIYTTINAYYNRHGQLPNFAEIEMFARDPVTKTNLIALERAEIPEDIDLFMAVDALIDEYTQSEALNEVDKLLSKIQLLDSEDIKRTFSEIALHLEEKTHTSESVVDMADVTLFSEETLLSRIPLNLNNEFDASRGGIALTDLWFLGGYRGAGKSVIISNIACSQYEQGNVCPIFSLEVKAQEVFERNMAILASVPYEHVKLGRCTDAELFSLAKVRCGMFLEGESALEKYMQHKNFANLESELRTKHKLKPDNQIVIIDNERLTIPDLDLACQKLKAKFKDKFKLAAVDYVNQIEIEDQFDWKAQTKLAKSLKTLARKYDISIVSPFQIDKSGSARFAQGLLDSVDIAANITAHENHINFSSVKTRNMKAFDFNAYIEWDTLRIDPSRTVNTEETTNEDVEPVKAIVGSDKDDLRF